MEWMSKILSKQKRYVCDTCKKVFETKSILNRHYYLTHTEPQTCTVCAKLCRNEKVLKKHLKDEHLDQTTEQKHGAVCKICLTVFTSSFLLSRHYTEEHSSDGFACQYCGKVYKKRTLRSHFLQSKSCLQRLHETARLGRSRDDNVESGIEVKQEVAADQEKLEAGESGSSAIAVCDGIVKSDVETKQSSVNLPSSNINSPQIEELVGMNTEEHTSEDNLIMQKSVVCLNFKKPKIGHRCSICSVVLNSEWGLARHQREMHASSNAKIRSRKSPIQKDAADDGLFSNKRKFQFKCGRTLATRKEIASRLGWKKKKHQCRVCKRLYSTKVASNRCKNKHKNGTAKCCHCSAMFQDLSHFTTHMRAVHKKPAYPCTTCDLEFTERRHLTVHLNKSTYCASDPQQVWRNFSNFDSIFKAAEVKKAAVESVEQWYKDTK